MAHHLGMSILAAVNALEEGAVRRLFLADPEMAAYTLQHPGHAGLETPEWNVAKFMGFSFDDTDVYKTIEGASYVLQTYPDQKLKAYIDSVLDVVGAAQEPDGYLYTARTINPAHPHQWAPRNIWSRSCRC